MRKLLAVLALVPGIAAAVPITYEFSGTIDHFESGGDQFDTLPGIQVGTSFSGLFFYTPDTAGCVALQSGSLGCTNLASFHMQIGEFSYYSDIDTSVSGANGISSTFMPVWSDNESFAPHDFGFSALDTLYFGGNMRFRDSDGDLINGAGQSFGGAITSWTPVEVPEPGTIGLFAIGLLGVVMSHKSARQSNLA